jgi:DNA-binding MarR family transcriptional regulator
MEPSKKISNQLLLLVPLMIRIFRNELKAVVPPEQLTIAQFRILAGLHHGLNQINKLTEQQGVSQPAMSKLIDGLIKKGLIERHPHPTDRRQHHLQFTPKGEALFLKVQERVLKVIAGRFRLLAKNDQKTAGHGIEKVLEMLGTEGSTK